MPDQQSFFVVSEVRSGSTYISETIAYTFHESFNIDFWPLTKEGFAPILDDPAPGVAENMIDRMYTNSLGYRSAMIKIGHLAAILRSVGDDERVREKFFGPNVSWLIVRRRNLVRQAISLAFAHKSGLYHYYGDADQSDDRNASVSMPDVLEHFRSIVAARAYLDMLQPHLARSHTVYYEDFTQNPELHVREVIQNLSLPGDPDKFVLGSAKLVATAQPQKQMLEREFEEFFLKTY